MKQKFVTYLFLILPFLLSDYKVFAIEDNDKENWLDPDAWTRDHLSLDSLQPAFGKCCKCSEVTTENGSTEKSQTVEQINSENVASIIYFKKLITMLFSRKHLKYDSTLQIYKRAILFTLQPSQLHKLEQLQDPRDLDNILTEIFENVRIPNMYRDGERHYTTAASSGFVSSVFQLFYNILNLAKMSEIRFLLVFTAAILIGCIIKNRYNIGLLTLICGSIFVYGYLHTYLECNREIEVNKMLDLLKRTKEEDKTAKDSSVMKFFKGLFFSDEIQHLEHEKLKNSAKLSLGFCRPDHVLIMYFNDIFLKYLQVLLEQCSSTLTSLNGTLSFPYNIISGILLIIMICYILKLTFKYILNPSTWVQFVHKKQHEAELTALKNTQGTDNEDRISGENLKLLLHVIKGPSYQNTKTALEVSGVQEVKESIESPPEHECKSPDKISAKETHNNSDEKLFNGISNVKLEDLSENS